MPKTREERTAADLRMANYSSVFQDTINEFVSPYVPGNRGDEGKGQVTARAGYKISLTNPSIGYIGKSGGQTQYHGISVDAIQDKSSGYGADYLTDELQPDGSRLIRVAYTPYPTPSVPPDHNWVQPTTAMLEYGGPLVLKNAPPEPPDPGPDDGRPDQYPDDAPWPAPVILPTWATDGTDLYSLDWYAQMSGNVETIYLNLLWRWSDFRGAANWLHNIREDQMSPAAMTDAIMQSDEYLALHSDA